MKNICKNILVTVIIFIFLLLATEIFFRLFMVQSDGVQFTLISKAWFKRYWYPINSFGYRDTEHAPDSLKGKKVIFVVGDSFVAGQGIKNYQDRFSNLLQDKLGEGVVAINIAQCGWSTEDEYRAIRMYPYTPDIIIVMYLVNDIEGAAKIIMKAKNISPGRLEPVPIIKFFVNNSYFFNYIYYRLYVKFSPKVSNNYGERIRNYYLNERIIGKYQEDLINLSNYARDINSRLVFIFPQFGGSNLDYIHNLIEFLKTEGVGVIDMKEQYTSLNIDIRNLHVSKIDFHPNEKANRIFADTIFEYIMKNKLLEASRNN